ncbi:MAG: GIY-YIG nuclease family protein [Candidatus Latescibacteria bacterium]|nr:GIY-YIG nuclease family protein [Candidatus Latescibacterota bacterium]
MIWYLYIVRTVDRHLYAGVSTDVERRFSEHLRQGRKAARYLCAHRPAHLVFSQAIGSRPLALKVEYSFKQLTRVQKERIVRAGWLCFDGVSGRIEVPVR